MCISVPGIIMGEQTRIVLILQNAEMPPRSVREQSVVCLAAGNMMGMLPLLQAQPG